MRSERAQSPPSIRASAALLCHSERAQLYSVIPSERRESRPHARPIESYVLVHGPSPSTSPARAFAEGAADREAARYCVNAVPRPRCSPRPPRMLLRWSVEERMDGSAQRSQPSARIRTWGRHSAVLGAAVLQRPLRLRVPPRLRVKSRCAKQPARASVARGALSRDDRDSSTPGLRPSARNDVYAPLAMACRSATPARTSGATSVPSSSIARITVRCGIPIR